MADLVAISLDDYCLTTNPVAWGAGEVRTRSAARSQSRPVDPYDSRVAGPPTSLCTATTRRR